MGLLVTIAALLAITTRVQLTDAVPLDLSHYNTEEAFPLNDLITRSDGNYNTDELVVRVSNHFKNGLPVVLNVSELQFNQTYSQAVVEDGQKTGMEHFFAKVNYINDLILVVCAFQYGLKMSDC